MFSLKDQLAKIVSVTNVSEPHSPVNTPGRLTRSYGNAARAEPSASIADTAGAKPVAYVNGDELDNMLEDRVATIQGRPDGWRKTPLFANQPERMAILERVCEGITDEMIDGGWTALGLSRYAKSLEKRIADTAGAKPVNPAAVEGEARRDAIARSRRILALVDEYANVQSKYNRDVLRETLFNEFATDAIAAPPAPSVADAKCMCSGLGPCEKLSNCRKAPSVADAAGASEAYRKALSAVNNSRTIYEAEVYLQRLLVAAIAKESGNE